MKYNFFFIMGLLGLSSMAQPNITKDNFNNYWRKFVHGVVSNPSGVTDGANGANQTWDLSTKLNATDFDTISHSPIHVDPDKNMYPEATGVSFSSWDSVKNYYQVKDDGLYYFNDAEDILGSSSIMKFKMMSFPFTYGSISKDSMLINTSFLGDSTGMLPFDSIRINGKLYSTSTGVGYGTLKLPQGNYPNTVKIKTEIKTDLLIEVRLRLTKSWIDASTFFPSDNFNVIGYLFVSKDYQDIVMSMDMDTLNAVEEVRYRIGVNSSIDKKSANNSVKVYPNPASENFMVEINGSANLTIVDLQGKLIKNESIFGNTLVDMSTLPKGLYMYKVQQGEQLTQGKILLN